MSGIRKAGERTREQMNRILNLSEWQRRLLALKLKERGAAPADQRLVAYVVAADDAKPEPAGLRDHLAALLPPYMIPATFVVLDDWPRTSNGKTDRQALRRLALSQSSRSGGSISIFVPPRNQTEQGVANIWQELLGMSRIGVNDNFFDLGGHSLLLVRLQSRLRDELKLELSIVDLFRYPTISSQATASQFEKSDSVENSQARERARKQSEAIAGRKQTPSGGDKNA